MFWAGVEIFDIAKADHAGFPAKPSRRAKAVL
jgi:hypothetical protein